MPVQWQKTFPCKGDSASLSQTNWQGLHSVHKRCLPPEQSIPGANRVNDLIIIFKLGY